MLTPRDWERYEQLRARGWSIKASADGANMSYSSARLHEKKRSAQVESLKKVRGELAAGAPIPLADLKGAARDAVADFGLFQRRYFGRIATPWQVDAAERIAALVSSPEKEYVVLNAPPGSGKSTTFTLDIPAWLTVRNRAIRGQIGSRTQSQAQSYVLRLRRALEATMPVKAEGEALARGLAVDADATLIDDFGRFKPELTDVWSAQQFVVAQWGDQAIVEKESTWSAYGFDSGYLGMRYDFVVWDDLVDKAAMRTAEGREKLQEQWDDIAEKRLEPGGLLVLQGQRLGPDDLYRYALNKVTMPDDADPEDEGEGTRKYTHIVYPAHDESKCAGDHKQTAAYWPDGCLLDPRRVSWRDLRNEMANPRNNYRVIYQQEDSDPDDVLVNPLWVTGGTDPNTHEYYMGCLDRDRDVWEWPADLHGQTVVWAAVDPSPTKFWSIQLWMARCEDGQAKERYLIAHYRNKLDIPGFLDKRRGTNEYAGLADEWQKQSELAGHPIQYWIVEQNAAQRFMLQTETVRQWLADHHVTLIPHTTSTNKSNPEYGVQSVAGAWRDGNIRLPYKGRRGAAMGDSGYFAAARLIEEVTHWPQWSTDDCVMAHWFGELHLPNLIPKPGALPRFPRPKNVMLPVRTFALANG